VIWRATYEPFGLATPDEDPDGNGAIFALDLRLPGQVFDPESGGHYNWNRYYDTGLGAYESADPLGLRAGLNAYRYGFANPLGWTDFEGLQSYADDTISARAKSLAARGRYQDLKDFLSQHADDIPKDKAEQLLKACKNALEKRAKAAEKLRKTDPDFADYFHRRYKPDGGVTPGGGRSNSDARAEELVDAAEEYFGPSF
jgi:RHS repeat-associated protein